MPARSEDIQNELNSKIETRRRLIYPISITGIAILLMDAAIIGNIAYTGKWVTCGAQATIVQAKPAKDFLESPEYEIVSNGFFVSKYPLIFRAMNTTKVFCTEQEAREFILDHAEK